MVTRNLQLKLVSAGYSQCAAVCTDALPLSQGKWSACQGCSSNASVPCVLFNSVLLVPRLVCVVDRAQNKQQSAAGLCWYPLSLLRDDFSHQTPRIWLCPLAPIRRNMQAANADAGLSLQAYSSSLLFCQANGICFG